MKKLIFPFVTLMLPLLSHADVISTLKSLEAVRTKTALCGMKEEARNKLISSFVTVKKQGKQGEFVASALENDLKSAGAECSKRATTEESLLISDILAEEPDFPVDIMKPFSTGEEERRLNDLALTFIQTKENNTCPTVTLNDVYNNEVWHNLVLTSGWTCVSKNYHELSQTINEEKGFGEAQKLMADLDGRKLEELKKLFKQKLGGKELKIAFIPHLSWENGQLTSTFPYSLFMKKTELTSYKFLVRKFKQMGIKAVFIERNSLAALSDQVIETRKKILDLDGPHLFISRSMGSRVMREIVAANDTELNSKILGWMNVGGTPHGSVIAKAKFHADSFYGGVVPGVVDAMKLPVNLIAKDPRVPDHLMKTLMSALDRHNLNTMSPVQARELSSNIPVMNAVFVRRDHERAAPGVDPIWMHMLQYGPTEGSSPLAGAAVDTNHSLRLMMDSDHLAFWKYTPTEGLEVYLRLLIVGLETKLIP